MHIIGNREAAALVARDFLSKACPIGTALLSPYWDLPQLRPVDLPRLTILCQESWAILSQLAQAMTQREDNGHGYLHNLYLREVHAWLERLELATAVFARVPQLQFKPEPPGGEFVWKINGRITTVATTVSAILCSDKCLACKIVGNEQNTIQCGRALNIVRLELAARAKFDI